MRDRIEKSLPGKDYQYVGYSRTSRVYYIFRPTKKGKDWYMRTRDIPYRSKFCRTLSECNHELGAL